MYVTENTIGNEKLDQIIWKIWGHCRENRNSLNSDVMCGIIRGVVMEAVAGVEARARRVEAELKDANSRVRKARKLYRDISREHTELLEAIESSIGVAVRVSTVSEAPQEKS